MHVVLPELDGRVLAGAVAFKDPLPPHDGLAFTALTNRPEPDRIAMVADRIAALVRLRTTPRGERRIAVLMPDYPGAPGRTGYAVGLDVPASVIALLDDLAAAGYAVTRRSGNAASLLDALAAGSDAATLRIGEYETLLARAAGCRGRAAARCLGRAGGRSRRARRRASASARKHSASISSRCRPTAAARPTAAPIITIRRCRRAMRCVAFGLWLQHVAKVDALVHMGAHGTLEWLPGKAVALTAECFPEIVTGRCR